MLLEAVSMRSLRLFPVAFSTLLSISGVVALAQANGGDWQKSYPVAGKPSLYLSAGDASVDVRSCGGCREVRVRVEWRDRKPSDYTLNESHSGNQVNFELKEKPRMGFHIGVGNRQEPRITVETPAALDLQAHTSDGALKVSGVQGYLELHTSDGAVNVEDAGGALRLTASDGSIRVHNFAGTLESRSADGAAEIEGRFTALQVHTSDGSLKVTLYEGTQLTAPSRIESSDGRVTVRLPRKLAADLDVHTSDGRIDCALPLTMEGYKSSGDSDHNLRGHLNGGGAQLLIHTSDGSVSISAL
jgi:hypothetical protein